ARGVLRNSNANIALAISGVAGPSGGTSDKPVGMVCFGWIVFDGNAQAEIVYFDGNRDSIRKQSVEYALKGLLKMLDNY
ncbi:MAG TPA: CinA family protein, partial [Leucothrix sp.]|nr:CinA family protein [Leucothrix sp.]